MTLRKDQIGDSGLRFEVQAFGYPVDGRWNVVGWAGHVGGAQQMASAIILAPGCTEVKIVDRQTMSKIIGAAQ